MRPLPVLLLALAAGIAPARADTARTMREALDRFMPYAGEPVPEIRSYRYYNWRPLGQEWFALWTLPNDGVYLVRVELPCRGIDDARSIAISSTLDVVDARTDHVSFGGITPNRCDIAEIRPVDYQRMRADDRAAGRPSLR